MDINPINNETKQLLQSGSKAEMPQPLSDSIFGLTDKDKNGEISVEEAKEYGFTTFEVTETLKKDKFLAKVKNYNQQLESQSKKPENSQIPNKFMEKLGLDLKLVDGQLMIKVPGLYNEYYPLDKALKEHGDDDLYALKLSDTTLTGIDFEKYPEVLKRIGFSNTTFGEGCKFPKGYDTKTVMENGKNPGLNVKAMHKITTGKGVNIAIIDSNLNPHENYSENIVHYEETDGAKTAQMHFHGAAVTSIAVGKKTGVAPDAQAYYMATSSAKEHMAQDELQALQRVLEINNTLPQDKKIRFVSISAPLYNKNSDAVIKELEEQGIWVMTSNEFEKRGFSYLTKKDPMSDPDDFSNYTRPFKEGDGKSRLYINSGERTVALPTDDKSYRHDSKYSMSWAIPYVAGLYACACQVKPDITPQEFIETASKTARTQSDTINIPAEIDIHNYGYVELLKKTAKELYPDISFEKLGNDREKQVVVCNLVNKRYEKNINNVIQELSEPYRQQLLKEGKIDENNNYIPPKTDTREINIIDAKALMEALKKSKK